MYEIKLYSKRKKHIILENFSNIVECLYYFMLCGKDEFISFNILLP